MDSVNETGITRLQAAIAVLLLAVLTVAGFMLAGSVRVAREERVAEMKRRAESTARAAATSARIREMRLDAATPSASAAEPPPAAQHETTLGTNGQSRQ